MTPPHVFRDVSMSAADAAELREIADRLDVFGDATDDRRWHAWSGKLRLLARRFERQDLIEIGPGVHVNPVDVSRDVCSAWLERPVANVVEFPVRAFRVIDGGAA